MGANDLYDDLVAFLSKSSIEELQKAYGRDFVEYNRFLLRGHRKNREEAFQKFKYSIVEVYDRLANKRGLLLDVGCGFGLHSIFFSELGYEVVLLNITRREMEIASKLVKDFGNGCHTLITDARRACAFIMGARTIRKNKKETYGSAS